MRGCAAPAFPRAGSLALLPASPVVTKMPAPSVVPTPTLGTPVAKAATEAMTSHAALPTARKVTPATCGKGGVGGGEGEGGDARA
jgi:hypothetical protein